MTSSTATSKKVWSPTVKSIRGTEAVTKEELEGADKRECDAPSINADRESVPGREGPVTSKYSVAGGVMVTDLKERGRTGVGYVRAG